MIILTHIPLGKTVLKRGIIFIDLAIAQAAALGLIVSELLSIENHLLEQGFALTFALLAGLFFSYKEKKSPIEQEAIIGLSYIFFATTAILLLSYSSHGNENFKNLLTGEILFISWHQILFHLPTYVFVLLMWFKFKKQTGIWFYLLFALAITSSVQLVGVFMVFTSLIAPALLLRHYSLALQYIIGIIALILAIFLSLLYDLSTSSLCILSLIFISIIANKIKKS